MSPAEEELRDVGLRTEIYDQHHLFWMLLRVKACDVLAECGFSNATFVVIKRIDIYRHMKSFWAGDPVGVGYLNFDFCSSLCFSCQKAGVRGGFARDMRLSGSPLKKSAARLFDHR